jgi:hypothetical protein
MLRCVRHSVSRCSSLPFSRLEPALHRGSARTPAGAAADGADPSTDPARSAGAEVAHDRCRLRCRAIAARRTRAPRAQARWILWLIVASSIGLSQSGLVTSAASMSDRFAVPRDFPFYRRSRGPYKSTEQCARCGVTLQHAKCLQPPSGSGRYRSMRAAASSDGSAIGSVPFEMSAFGQSRQSRTCARASGFPRQADSRPPIPALRRSATTGNAPRDRPTRSTNPAPAVSPTV